VDFKKFFPGNSVYRYYFLWESGITNMLIPTAIKITGHQVFNICIKLILTYPKLVSKKNIPTSTNTIAAKFPLIKNPLLCDLK